MKPRVLSPIAVRAFYLHESPMSFLEPWRGQGTPAHHILNVSHIFGCSRDGVLIKGS